MTFATLKNQFDRDGFVVVRQLLAPAELDELQRNLERYIRDVVPNLPAADAFFTDRERPETLKQLQHMAGDAFFRDYPANPALMELATALIGEAVQGDEPEWFNKPAGTNSPTPPHQDNYYFCLTPPHVATLWMALDAIDDENGCLRYVRGSHLRGVRPHTRSSILGFSQTIADFGNEPNDRAAEVAVHLQPGDVVAHHGNTIHRADANRSPTRQRRAFAIVYRSLSCRRDEAAHARYRAALESQHAALGVAGS